MKRYRRIGVFLTGSPADDVALGYAGRFALLAESEKVLCVYVHGGGPEAAGSETIDVEELRERAIAALPESVAKNTEVEVHAGGAVAEILKSARDLELDLIVKGRRLPAHQAAVGSAFTKLARKAPCSVLIVPNYCLPHFSRIHVSVDLSMHSRLALEMALEIACAGAVADEEPQVLVHTVYSVGYGYRKLGMDFDQAIAKQGAVVRKQLDEFVADVDTSGARVEAICTCSEDTAAAVHELAAARKMDMIVVGSRGLSPAAAVILGGTAEEILLRAPQPVLVVKRKGETIGLLDALLAR
ncbi:MAG: universal stress protein [Phycisphaerae bacterium]